ncbi:hypothetical protein ES705_29231 [subsurface metagenome]
MAIPNDIGLPIFGSKLLTTSWNTTSEGGCPDGLYGICNACMMDKYPKSTGSIYLFIQFANPPAFVWIPTKRALFSESIMKRKTPLPELPPLQSALCLK